MQYKVPQDVQREDTIIGPITLKQLIILGIGGGIAYAIYIGLSKAYFIEIWLPPVAIISVITLAIAFLKIHNIPFHEFLMNFIEYHVLPKKRIWIQGTASPFVPPFETKEKKKEEKSKTDKEKPKTLEELREIIETRGEAGLSKEEKKEELKKIINKNYQ